MKKYKQYIVLLLIILFLTGCKSGKEKEGEIQKKEKAPSSLSDFSQGLQDILNDVEKVEKILDGTDIEMDEEKVKKDDNKANDNKDKSNSEKGKEEEKGEVKDEEKGQVKDEVKDQQK